MKKFISIFLATALVILFTACASKMTEPVDDAIKEESLYVDTLLR